MKMKEAYEKNEDLVQQVYDSIHSLFGCYDSSLTDLYFPATNEMFLKNKHFKGLGVVNVHGSLIVSSIMKCFAFVAV